MTKPKAKAEFIDPMLLLRTDKLPEGDGWQYELLSWTGTAPSRSSPAAMSISAPATITTSIDDIRPS
jgi:hypothetical protein